MNRRLGLALVALLFLPACTHHPRTVVPMRDRVREVMFQHVVVACVYLEGYATAPDGWYCNDQNGEKDR
jgi:hypothetical protein